jgi:hypothetical protein
MPGIDHLVPSGQIVFAPVRVFDSTPEFEHEHEHEHEDEDEDEADRTNETNVP